MYGLAPYAQAAHSTSKLGREVNVWGKALCVPTPWKVDETPVVENVMIIGAVSEEVGGEATNEEIKELEDNSILLAQVSRTVDNDQTWR